MRLTKTLERLAAHGATIEQLIEVVRVHEEGLEEELANKREKERLRKRKQRSMSHDVPGTDRDNAGHLGTDGDLSSLNGFSPAYIHNLNTPSSLIPSLNSSFPEFWSIYPRKVGKGQAVKAWARAVKKVPPETILAAVRSYPWSADKEFIPHPASWLNGERWADETGKSGEPLPDPTRKALHEMTDEERTRALNDYWNAQEQKRA